MNKPAQRLIGLNLARSLSLTSLSSSPIAQAQTPSTTCSTTLKAIQTKLKEKPNLEIVSVTQQDIGDLYPDRPRDRPDWYVFALRGRQANTILNSAQFMNTLATQLIRNCPNVSLVTFGVANSGNTVLWGLMPNGTVQPFECLEPRRDMSRPAWGKTICV